MGCTQSKIRSLKKIYEGPTASTNYPPNYVNDFIHSVSEERSIDRRHTFDEKSKTDSAIDGESGKASKIIRHNSAASMMKSHAQNQSDVICDRNINMILEKQPSNLSSKNGLKSKPSQALQCLAACIPNRIVLQEIKNVEIQFKNQNANRNETSPIHGQMKMPSFSSPLNSYIVPPKSHCSSFDCAVLFVDISGFTSSMERFAEYQGRGIENFWRSISDYFASLLKEIYSRGGDVECFAGDAMMVSFGAEEISQHPIGRKILQKLMAKNGKKQSETEMKHSVAAMVAVDAAAAMLKNLTPYRRFEKDFWGKGKDLSLDLTLHGSVGAGRLTALELAEKVSEINTVAKKWHYVCGPVVGQLARAHEISEANDCVLSKKASSAVGAEAWGIPVGGGKFRMRGPDNFPQPLLTEDSNSSEQLLRSNACRLNSDESFTEQKLLPKAGIPKFNHIARSPAVPILGSWPQYEVSSLMMGRNFGKKELQKLEDALLAYVPEPLALRFQGSVKPAMCEQKENENSDCESGGGGPSLSWLGELRPAAVAFVTFDIGNINNERGFSSGRSGSSAFHPSSDSMQESDCSFSENECTFNLSTFMSSIGTDFNTDTEMSNNTVNITSETGKKISAKKKKKFIDIPRACLIAAETVLEQSGVVNKILMDEKGLSLIYAFGTPGSAFEDNSLRALRVGCTILSRLGYQNPNPNNLNTNTGGCNVNIGIATGQVCAAILGLSTVRCEYALVGDTVNLAARLAAHAAKTRHGMLVCPNTMETLIGKNGEGGKYKDHLEEFTINNVGSIRPKGKTTDVTIYDVKNAVIKTNIRDLVFELPASPYRPVKEAMTPMRRRTYQLILGREREFQAIKECIMKTVDGMGGGIVVLEGDAGVGKSVLLRKARKSLLSKSLIAKRRISFNVGMLNERRSSIPQNVSGNELNQMDNAKIKNDPAPRFSMSKARRNRSGLPLIIQVRCLTMDYLQPLLILSSIMRQVLAAIARPDSDGLYSTDRIACALHPPAVKLVPLLSKLRIGIRENEAEKLSQGFKHLPPDEVGRLIVTLCAALIEAAGNKFNGVVVFVDDLHQCDSGSLTAMMELIEGNFAFKSDSGEIGKLNLSLILTTRSEQYYPSFLKIRYHKLRELIMEKFLTLDRLNDKQANELACKSFGTDCLGPTLSATITKICKGNPLFVKEVCKMLLVQEKISIVNMDLDQCFESNNNQETMTSGTDLSSLSSITSKTEDHRNSVNSAVSGTSRSSHNGGRKALRGSHHHKKSIVPIFTRSLPSQEFECGSDADGENEKRTKSGAVKKATDEEKGDTFNINDLVLPCRKRTIARLKNSGHSEGIDPNLPSSLTDIAAAMIDRLDPFDALVLKIASVINGPFTAQMLIGLGVLPSLSATVNSLAVLSSKRLLESSVSSVGLRYTFVHELVRLTAYNMIFHWNKRQLHLRVAELISMENENELNRMQLVQHWLRVVEDTPSKEEVSILYNGNEGWANLLERALRSVIDAIKKQLLPFGSYQESEFHFQYGVKILADLKEGGPRHNEKDVLEFELSLLGMEIFERTKGHGCSEIPTLSERAIAISKKPNIKLKPTEVLQSKLFQAHYMLYKEHVLRDDSMDTRTKVLQPLYEEMKGRGKEKVLLRLEVLGILANDAIQKGALDTFKMFQDDVKAWNDLGRPDLLSLTLHDPIAIALGGHMIAKMMDINFIEYVKARNAFAKYMEDPSVRPHHLWTTMSLVMLTSCVTRELAGLQLMLNWIHKAVPERFRGTGLATQRMRLMQILSQVYAASASTNKENAPPSVLEGHLDWAQEWISDPTTTNLPRRNQSLMGSLNQLFNSQRGSNPVERSPFYTSEQPLQESKSLSEQFSDLIEEAKKIVEERPSPIMCSAGYQIGLLTENEDLMDFSLKRWEETGIGQAWANKSLRSITTSFLFYARAEFRLRIMRKEMEEKWANEEVVEFTEDGNQYIEDMVVVSRSSSNMSYSRIQGETSGKVKNEASSARPKNRKSRFLFENFNKKAASQTNDDSNPALSSFKKSLDDQNRTKRELRKIQLRENVGRVMPDIALAIRNARSQNHFLSLQHAQMLLAEVHLAKENAEGALCLLLPAFQARQNFPKVNRGSVTTDYNWHMTPPLSTLDAAESLWIRSQNLQKELSQKKKFRFISNNFRRFTMSSSIKVRRKSDQNERQSKMIGRSIWRSADHHRPSDPTNDATKFSAINDWKRRMSFSGFNNSVDEVVSIERQILVEPDEEESEISKAHRLANSLS